MKLAVFDMAGTTICDNDVVAAAFHKAFLLHGFNVAKEEINSLMGYKKSVAIQKVLSCHHSKTKYDLVEQIHEDFVGGMITHYNTDPHLAATPGTEEIFVWLKNKGIRVALNTGFPKEIADAIINRFEWIQRGMVDEYIASDQVEHGRPSPDMIRLLMKSAGVTQSSCVFKVGDTEADILEGRNAGCGLVIGVTTGAYTREQLEPMKPDHIIDNLAELHQIIN